jgi:hypothetical protein
LTAVPLAPELPPQGQEVTDAAASRYEFRLADPAVQTGLFVLNPNGNDVQFLVTVIDQGREASASESVAGRGTAVPTQGRIFQGISQGWVRVQAQPNLMPGTGERLVPVVIYRSAKYVSALPAQ